MEKARQNILRDGYVSARTRWSYGLGCIGRDANYTLVNNWVLTFLTFAVGLADWQLGAVGVIMVAARIWDAANDPMMGTIIDNTRTRYGKFKPYILTGALLNAVLTVVLFTAPVSPAQQPTLFIAVFAITYVLWGMTYTMNDISYWGMLPNLTTDLAQRSKTTSLARIGANIGLFAVTALVPAFTAGQMTGMYRSISLVVAAVFVACQVLVAAGVEEKPSAITAEKSGARLRDIFRVVFKNDQLLAIAGAILLFNIGYFTTTSFAVQFFYFDYGVYAGMEFTYFALVIGAAQILTLAVSPYIFRGIPRRRQFGIGFVMVVTGYAGLMAVGYLLPMNMAVLCAVGFVLFAGQALIQLLNYVLLADTVEYGQWKLGRRNESITFSVNPFITKLASALQAAIFSFTMIASGLNRFSEEISAIENNAALSAEQRKAMGQVVVDRVPPSATLAMRLSMIVLPLALIVLCYVVYRKKYRLDEKTYAGIVDELNARAAVKADGARKG